MVLPLLHGPPNARRRSTANQVERGAELVGFAQDETGVTARIRHAGGAEEEVRALYLVGADGARSIVRQSLGVTFEGETEPHIYLLGDVKITGGGLDHRTIYIWWHQGGTVALFPFEEATWRIFAMRADSADTPPTLAELQAHMDRHGPPGARLHDPTWLSAFRINERLAGRYRMGRIFLAGDAAHIHSPAGGQGMNTGIQDATNLGWKLAHALRGLGNAELLLDSYEAERRPVAREVVDGAAQKLRAAFATGMAVRLIRDLAMVVAGKLRWVQKKLQEELSETQIVYRGGPLVELGAPPRHAQRTDVGTRARDADFIDPQNGQKSTLWPRLSGPHHALLVFEDAAAPIPLDSIATYRGKDLALIWLDAKSDPGGQVRDRYHIGVPGWVLVRPDQVVAARGGARDLARLANYLDHVLGASATS